jgi:hypothetical protein
MRSSQYRPMPHQLIEAVEFGTQRLFLTVVSEGIAPEKKGTPIREDVEDRVGCNFQIEKLRER